MDDSFDLEKWRKESPMDYILAMNLIKNSSYKDVVFHTIYRITRLYVPDVLYKFFALTDNIELNEQKILTLERQQIFMSDIKDMNDPFDNKAFFYRPDRLIKFPSLINCGGRIIDDFSNYIKGSAFTANDFNSMPMWAHYASNHRGFCISYDLKDKDNVGLAGCVFPVQYSSLRIDVTDIMEQQMEMMEYEIEKQMSEGKKQIRISDLTIVYMASFLCNIKHESWKYENEFRCTTGAIAKGMPYFPAKPKRMYIGMNCSRTYKERLVRVAHSLQIPVYKMKVHEFSLDFNLSYEELSM